ncbi:DnaB-like helicase C-terminal domain-containing protein [Kitasatospora misakiensis]|uniref:DnaB-like helicase C-terminal domain-containing protein n=1 Tax=Kitasatospora misakiensis TaxID=67330 RepID=A0ABW0X8Z2_9ACTN
MPAYQLVNPARGHLATPAGRKLKSALGAAARGKLTGPHWLALLTAPRGAFGGPTSQRAGQMYKALEQLVADHLRPALGAVAAAEFAAGVEPAQAPPAAPETDTTVGPAPLRPAPGSDVPHPATQAAITPLVSKAVDAASAALAATPVPDPGPAPVSTAAPVAGAAAAGSAPAPAADTAAVPVPADHPNPTAADTTVPPASPAAHPTADSLLQDLLTTVEHRAILCVTGPATTATPAIATATQQQLLPAVQVRPHPGTDEAALIHVLYTALGLDHRRPRPRARNAALELIAAELGRAARLLVVPDAHRLATAALQTLHGLWARGGPERFPLVLVGEPGLDTVLDRPKLASLKSTAGHHRLAPAPEARENALAASRPPGTAGPSGEDLVTSRPAVGRTAPEPATSRPRATDAGAHLPPPAASGPTAPALAVGPDVASPGPATTVPRSAPGQAAPPTGDLTPPPGPAFPDTPADDPVPAPAAAPNPQDTTVPTAPHTPAARTPAPVPPRTDAPAAGSPPTPAADTATVPDPVPLRPAPAPPLDLALVLAPSPQTLHQARSTLPQLIRAAGEGTSTPLARGTHHALLTAPTTATTLGWDLTPAPAHGTADARKKLGDLIQAAATGHPQVLRRHVTPLAVLLPATPDGTPLPPTTHPGRPAPGTPDTPATTPHSNEVVTITPGAEPAAPGSQPTPTPMPAAAEPVPATVPAAAAPLAPSAPSAPASSTAPTSNNRAQASTTRQGSTTPPGSGVDAPDDTLFPTPATPAATVTPGPAAPLLPLVDPSELLPLVDPDALLPLAADPPAPTGQPVPALAAVEPVPATAAPGQLAPADAEPATSSAPAPAAGEPALHAPAAMPPPATTAPAAPATPRPPRRLAPLADALTTVLTPQTPDPHTNTPAGPRALFTGIPTLDQALGGLQPGRFYLAAAAPGIGASLLATTTARTTALEHGLPVLYAASGLTRADVAARIVAAHLHVDYRRLRTGRLTPAEQADVTALHAELAAAHLYIDDGSDLTPDAIAETAVDLTHPTGQPGLALVVVDRLQALDDPRLPLSGPRLTDAAQALAHLARTHHVPVLAILDTDQHDLITTLSLDTTLTLHPHPDAPTTQLLVTIAERDLGTQATLTLTADRTHARLTNPTPSYPYATHHPAPEAPTPAFPWPTVAVPGHTTQNTPAAPRPDADAEVTPATAAALDTLTPDQPPTHPLRPTRDHAPRTTTSRPARTNGGDYAGRDYGYYLDMISSVVDQALQEHDGDTKATIAALENKAIPNAMALFEATRVGGNYEHTVYPERLEFLSKKTKKGADDIWEGRHKWENGPLMTQLKDGTLTSVAVDVLDTNAAYCSALKAWLPIGSLVHQPNGGFDPKRSGVYLLPERPTWHHPHLPDPIGNRREPGPVFLDDATIRLLIRCHKLDLCDPPYITQAWTSGASENIAEKFRRVLTTAREKAVLEGDKVTEEYIKTIYSIFVSTIGESTTNRDLRRPDWMHIFRSQAFANLWYKAYRAHEHGLTIVRLRGTDELHITGDFPWRTVFEEGRLTTQLKLKTQYTLGKAA